MLKERNAQKREVPMSARSLTDPKLQEYLIQPLTKPNSALRVTGSANMREHWENFSTYDFRSS